MCFKSFLGPKARPRWCAGSRSSELVSFQEVVKGVVHRRRQHHRLNGARGLGPCGPTGDGGRGEPGSPGDVAHGHAVHAHVLVDRVRHVLRHAGAQVVLRVVAVTPWEGPGHARPNSSARTSVPCGSHPPHRSVSSPSMGQVHTSIIDSSMAAS